MIELNTLKSKFDVQQRNAVVIPHQLTVDQVSK